MKKFAKALSIILSIAVIFVVLSFSGCGLSEQEEAEKQALLNDFSNFIVVYPSTVAEIDVERLSENAAQRFEDTQRDISRYMEIIAPAVSGDEIDKIKPEEIAEMRGHVETLNGLLADLTKIAADDLT